ncbi:COG3904 family protein [Rhizobium mongolense]
MNPGALAEFAGGLLGLFLITSLWSLIVSHLVPRTAVPVVASTLSLSTATILGGYSFGNGGAPAFAYSFGLYLFPQVIVLAIFWFRHQSAAAETQDEPALVPEQNTERTDAHYQTPPSSQVDADEHPEYRKNVRELVSEKDRLAPRSNFFARYWRGEFPLATSYWGVNFLVNLAVVALAATLTALLSPEEGFEPTSLFWFIFLLWLGIAVLLIWQVVGLWRSARHHAERQRQAKRTTFWAGAAQLAAVLGVLQTIGAFSQSGAPQIKEMYKIAFEDDPDVPPNELKLLGGGTELSVFGGIKYGLSNDVEQLLRAAPGVTVIHLTSSGGRIAEAGKLFKIVRDRGLETYVSNECSSACTLVFAAGTRRSLLEGARLGYHGPSFPGLDEAELRAFAEEWAKMYRETGLNRNFIDRALAVSPETMWYPSADELLQANAITSVVTGEGFALSGHETGPSLAAIEREMRAANGVIDALHLTSPETARAIYTTTRRDILAGKPQAQLREDVNVLISKAIAANLARADDETLAQYAKLMSAQYSALNAKDPALCFQYAAVGTNPKVASALPPELLALEVKLNERVLRTASDQPFFRPEDNDAAWALIFETMTAEQVEVFSLDPANIPSERYGQYCAAAIAVLNGISNLGTGQAAMLMRQMFSGH